MIFAKLAFVSMLVASTGSAKDLTHVKIVFIEALAPADTTSSQRFQNDYQRAASVGSSSIQAKLAQCGYDSKIEFSFYEAGDPIQAKVKAAEAEKNGAWMIVAPRRSNHYLLAASGAPDTPTVSLLASSDEIEKLNPLHVTMSPLNSTLVHVAVNETVNKLKGSNNKTFIAITSEDCISCREFSHQFMALAKKSNLRLLDEIKVTGELPDTKIISEAVEKDKPGFILLPSFSKTASHIMSNLRPQARNAFYVGGDGWGDSKFGFVQNGKNLDGVHGLTVRGYPPSDIGFQKFPLGRQLLSRLRSEELPSSSPALGIIRLLSSLPDILCNDKSRTKMGFAEEFKLHGKEKFNSPFGVNVFTLEEGLLNYYHSRKL